MQEDGGTTLPQFAEGEVTKLRREFKLLLEETETASLFATLRRALPGPLPCRTHITSVYFDKPGLPLTQRAIATPHDCLKVRTKQYDPDLRAGGVDRVVVEVKRERHGMTQKRRVWVPRAELSQVIGEKSGSRVLPLIAQGRLLPVLAVTYQREVFQSVEAWRVTVDRAVRFYPVRAKHALCPHRITEEELGTPAGESPYVVVEVKHLSAQLPDFLRALVGRQTQSFSKFALGMRALAAVPARSVQGG